MHRRIRRGIDLIDAPVVSRIEIKALGRRVTAGILRSTGRAIVDVAEYRTKVNPVPVDGGYIISRLPAQDHLAGYIRRPVAGTWTGRFAKSRCSGFLIILIGGHVVGIIRPHEHIHDLAAVALPVIDVHCVLAVSQFFGMTLRVVSPAPCPVAG
ncbi:MAG: hypothetical protein ACYS74_15260 [Planctomycetota bacterium]